MGGKSEWTLYLLDRNFEMSVREDLPFLGLWLQGSRRWMKFSGSHSLVAVYMSENFFGGQLG